jgi:hypothetical protein
MMNWAELGEMIAKMKQEDKQQDVTVFVSGVGEFYPTVGDYPFLQAESSDVLDEGHWYLVI